MAQAVPAGRTTAGGMGRVRQRAALVLLVLVAAALAAFAWALSAGELPVTATDLLAALGGGAGSMEADIIRTLRLPDLFQDQDAPDKQYEAAGLDAAGIVDSVLKALRHNSAGVEEARA